MKCYYCRFVYMEYCKSIVTNWIYINYALVVIVIQRYVTKRADIAQRDVTSQILRRHQRLRLPQLRMYQLLVLPLLVLHRLHQLMKLLWCLSLNIGVWMHQLIVKVDLKWYRLLLLVCQVEIHLRIYVMTSLGCPLARMLMHMVCVFQHLFGNLFPIFPCRVSHLRKQPKNGYLVQILAISFDKSWVQIIPRFILLFVTHVGVSII